MLPSGPGKNNSLMTCITLALLSTPLRHSVKKKFQEKSSNNSLFLLLDHIFIKSKKWLE